MGLLGTLILKGVTTAARNSTIRAAEKAAVSVINAQAKNPSKKQTVIINNHSNSIYIKPTRSYEGYCGENALDVAQELLGAGFDNITFKPMHRLGPRSRKRYGEVESVTINGKDSFLGIKKVPSTSLIVIRYLDFKESVSSDVYDNLIVIPSNVLPTPSIELLEQSPPTPTPSPIESVTSATSSSQAKRFCPYCGEPVTATNARFCSSCGEQI